MHPPDSQSLRPPVQVAWLTVITQLPILPSVPPAPNPPLQTKMRWFVEGSGKLSGRAAGAPLPSGFPVQLATSVPGAAPISLSFLSPCLWPSAPLSALLRPDDGWRLGAMLVGVPAASPAPGQAKGRLRQESELWQGKPMLAGVGKLVGGCAEL